MSSDTSSSNHLSHSATEASHFNPDSTSRSRPTRKSRQKSAWVFRWLSLRDPPKPPPPRVRQARGRMDSHQGNTVVEQQLPGRLVWPGPLGFLPPLTCQSNDQTMRNCSGPELPSLRPDLSSNQTLDTNTCVGDVTTSRAGCKEKDFVVISDSTHSKTSSPNPSRIPFISWASPNHSSCDGAPSPLFLDTSHNAPSLTELIDSALCHSTVDMQPKSWVHGSAYTPHISRSYSRSTNDYPSDQETIPWNQELGTDYIVTSKTDSIIRMEALERKFPLSTSIFPPQSAKRVPTDSPLRRDVQESSHPHLDKHHIGGLLQQRTSHCAAFSPQYSTENTLNVRTPRKLKKKQPPPPVGPVSGKHRKLTRSRSEGGHSQTSSSALWTANSQWETQTSSPIRFLLKTQSSPVNLGDSHLKSASAPSRKLTKKHILRQRLEEGSKRYSVLQTMAPLPLERSNSSSFPSDLGNHPTPGSSDSSHIPLSMSSVSSDGHVMTALSPESLVSLDSPELLLPSEIQYGHTSAGDSRSQPHRRWTLAICETPDEQLATELKRLRSIGLGLGYRGEFVKCRDQTPDQYDGHRDEAKVDQWSAGWQALMVCREIIRTEVSYRQAMVSLQRGETDREPSPLLLQYLPALVSASHSFNTRLRDDPSTWGVSVAFIDMEDTLEAALVAWCGIVGEFFSTGQVKQRRRWSIGGGDKEKRKGTAAVPAPPPSRNSDWGRDAPQMTCDPGKSPPRRERMSMPTLSRLWNGDHDGHQIDFQKYLATSGSAKRFTVRDLAIQPTQRVTRYVLLYKDLLKSTPVASPARPLVERALESARRIAHRCNKAQNNAAFLAP